MNSDCDLSPRLTSRSRSAPRPGSRKPIPLVLAAMVLLVSGCGQEGDAGSSPSSSTSLPANSATPHISTEAQPSNATPTRGAARAMGVDTARWPGTLAAAKPLFARMPHEIAGMAAHHPAFAGDSAGVTYGPSANGAVAYVMGTDNEVTDPTAVLSFMFGMASHARRAVTPGQLRPHATAADPTSTAGEPMTRRNRPGGSPAQSTASREIRHSPGARSRVGQRRPRLAGDHSQRDHHPDPRHRNARRGVATRNASEVDPPPHVDTNRASPGLWGRVDARRPR